MMYSHKTWVEISRSALFSNIASLRRRVKGDALFMAVVKANAYGHGLLKVGPEALAAGADWLGVDYIDEALSLRADGIDAPILVLGYTLVNRLEEAVKNNIRLVVYNNETVQELSRVAGQLGKTARVHLKVETGTSRQGLLGPEAVEFAKRVKALPNLQLEGLSTHFANIEDTTDHTFAEQQLREFQKVRQEIEAAIGGKIPICHTACSAALILFPETHFDMVRAGISLYGHWSSPQTHASAKEKGIEIELRPVLAWKTRVAQIKKLPKGAAVGYGLTEKVSRDSTVAVLPVGYWDGLDRKLSSIGEVLIRGARAKIIGRVCMNMAVVDITDIPGATVEDEVIIIGSSNGEKITAEDLAAKIGTINYEVLTRINPVIKRVIVE